MTQQQRKTRIRKTRLEGVCTYFIVSFAAPLPSLSFLTLPFPIISYHILSYLYLTLLPYPTPTILNPTLLHLLYSIIILPAGATVPPRITPAFEDPRVTFMTPPTLQGFGTQHSMQPKPIKFNVRNESCEGVHVRGILSDSLPTLFPSYFPILHTFRPL